MGPPARHASFTALGKTVMYPPDSKPSDAESKMWQLKLSECAEQDPERRYVTTST
jgi:hypothetical protein